MTMTRLIVIVALAAGTTTGCFDRSSDYDTISEARHDHVFEKGWLPDFLPNSTKGLSLVTSVENSTGHGEFRFDPLEYPAFSAKLRRHTGVVTGRDVDEQLVKELIAQGFEARKYSSGVTNWIFLCSQQKATCHFFVWQ
jgi:hypothetical protein